MTFHIWTPPAATDDQIAALKAYVKAGANNVGSQDDDFIAECANAAIAMVAHRCGKAWDRVPPVILDRVHLEVGSELYNRRNAPSGISQFTAPDGSQARLSRDPMTGAETILAPYLPLGFS